MSDLIELFRVVKALKNAYEICEGCTFEGEMCYGCHIYYDRQKYLKDLRMFVCEVFSDEQN